jgi:hypothetical protein
MDPTGQRWTIVLRQESFNVRFGRAGPRAAFDARRRARAGRLAFWPAVFPSAVDSPVRAIARRVGRQPLVSKRARRGSEGPSRVSPFPTPRQASLGDSVHRANRLGPMRAWARPKAVRVPAGPSAGIPLMAII